MKFPSWEPTHGKWATVVDGLLPIRLSRADVTVGSSTSALHRNAEVSLTILAAIGQEDDLVADVTGFEGVVGDVYGDLTIGDKAQVNRRDLCSLHT